jgi:beta-phosphoglucomutase-like phosphatase (HAD superfamily)
MFYRKAAVPSRLCSSLSNDKMNTMVEDTEEEKRLPQNAYAKDLNKGKPDAMIIG